MNTTSLRHRATDYLFAIWMSKQPLEGSLVTPEIVAEQFGVSRATSYRWLSSYRSALRLLHDQAA